MQLITVEGNIGTGKSTLAHQIAEALDFSLMKEPVEENPYLNDFYKDPKGLAFKMQFWLLHTRFRQHKSSVDHIWKTGQGVVQDRSIYGDQMFAHQHYLAGNMSLLDYETYLAHREMTNAQLLAPHVCIFLEADPARSLERIRTRGRPFEQDIPLAYLQGLQERHAELMVDMKRRGSNVVRIDWNEFKPVEEVVQMIGLSHLLRKKTVEFALEAQ